jgi:predicted Zn-dependent protease with MMP-like domain
MKLTTREFEKLVEDGLALIPDEIRSRINNVQIVIEDEPGNDLLEELGVLPEETLFGLYTGIPLTERTSEYSTLPDRIIIYRRPLIEEFDDPHALRHEVARTIIHEVAHHFGIDEERLVELGWD